LEDKADKVTREETRTSYVQLVTKTDAQQTIFCIKSSLSTIPPCLPSPALTDNIKNLPLSVDRINATGVETSTLLAVSMVKQVLT
jgi:hypothetical protein